MIPGIVGSESPHSFLASIVQTDPQAIFVTGSTVKVFTVDQVTQDQVTDCAV